MRTVHFDTIINKKIRGEIKQKLINEYKGKGFEQMILHRFKIQMYRQYDTTKELFNIDFPAIAKDVLNTMRSLQETGIVKKIMKKYRFKTNNLPCTRSPFPLWFPWFIHYGYKYFRNYISTKNTTWKGGMGMGTWGGNEDVYCRQIKKLATKLNVDSSLGFEFIDKDIVRQKLSGAGINRDYAQSLEKLIQLNMWMEGIANI